MLNNAAEAVTMATQSTLLVTHKGVDLHAATAVRVMRRRLEGGDGLLALHRGEVHTFWGEGDGRSVADLLQVGRYFNPNKHHHGHFVLPEASFWDDRALIGGAELPAGWPGEALGGDLPTSGSPLDDALLGGAIGDGCVAVDVLAVPLGEEGVLRSRVNGVELGCGLLELPRRFGRAPGGAGERARRRALDHAQRLADR